MLNEEMDAWYNTVKIALQNSEFSCTIRLKDGRGIKIKHMWRPVSGSFHYARTERDYSNLIQLRAKYKNRQAPIDELKAACLADGYPQSKVDSLRYPDTTHDDVEQILGRKKCTPRVQELELVVEAERVVEADEEPECEDAHMFVEDDIDCM